MELTVAAWGGLKSSMQYFTTCSNLLATRPAPLNRLQAGDAGGMNHCQVIRSVVTFSYLNTFIDPTDDIIIEEEFFDFRLLALPAIYTLPCTLNVVQACYLELDLLILQTDYAFLASPELPVESSAMVRLIGSRVPLVQANTLVLIASHSRPTATRPMNSLIYLRGLMLAQSFGELELFASGAPQDGGNPLGSQPLYRGAIAPGGGVVPAGERIGPNCRPGVIPNLGGMIIIRVRSDQAAAAVLEQYLGRAFVLAGPDVSLQTAALFRVLTAPAGQIVYESSAGAVAAPGAAVGRSQSFGASVSRWTDDWNLEYPVVVISGRAWLEVRQQFPAVAPPAAAGQPLYVWHFDSWTSNHRHTST